MFLDSIGTISISLPPGWAFDALSSSLLNLVFLDWTAANERQVFARVFPSHTGASDADDAWEKEVRSHLPPEATRVERRKGPAGPVVLVERPGREGRPAQRWAIIRGPRLDVVIEQVGVPLGGALLTPEIAEALRTLDVPANRQLLPPQPQSAFHAAMQSANAAFHTGKVVEAAQGLARAREIAKSTWLYSLVGSFLPEVPAAISEAQAALALAEVTGSAMFLQQATHTLHRCRNELRASPAKSGAKHIANAEMMITDAMRVHGKLSGESAPENPFQACLVRCRLLQRELMGVLESDQPKIGGPWATLAVDDAMSSAAYAGRQLIRTLTPDLAAMLTEKGITSETEQVEVANQIFVVTALDHLVAAGGLLAAARAQAALDADRSTSANWLLAARKLVALSPSPERDRGLVLALNANAGALVSLGDEPSLADAGRLLAEAGELLDGLGDEGELRAQICLNQGWLRHMRRQFDGSLPIVERAIQAAQYAHAERLERAARSLRSQFLAVAGRHEEAIAEARLALETTHDDAASTHQLNLAVALHLAGRNDEALDALRAGLAAAVVDEPVGPDVLRLLFVAAALLDETDSTQSLAVTEAAEVMLDALRQRLGDAVDRLGFDDADRHREVAATLVQRRLAANDILGALATADRHRARSLVEASTAGKGSDDQSGKGQPSPVPPPGAPLDDLVVYVAACAGARLARKGLPPYLDGRALADIVANTGRTAIVFHPSAEEMLIFVVRPGDQVIIGCAVATQSVGEILRLTDALRAQLGIVVAARAARGEAPEQSLEDLAKALADDEIEAAEDELDGLRHALHDALFSEVLPLLVEDEPIVVIPYRELAVIPLSVLIDQDGRLLAERHPVSVAPSLASLAAVAKAPGDTAHAIVVGDPTTDASLHLGPLGGAAAEARSVADALKKAGLDTALLLHQDATEAALRNHVQAVRVVHFACHATVQQTASASCLFLAPAPPDDGMLLPEEIADLRFDGALVVLAACQSGLGRTTADGVLGLGHAFLRAGARAVVLSLWRVSDEATALLMETLYGALLGQAADADKLDVAGALRLAQAATRETGAAHPSLWGPWLIVGDGGWRIE